MQRAHYGVARSAPACRPKRARVRRARRRLLLPKQQRSFGWRRSAAATQIRPSRQRAARGAGAAGLVLCQKAGVSPALLVVVRGARVERRSELARNRTGSESARILVEKRPVPSTPDVADRRS